MRAITKESINAFLNKKPFKKDNMHVEIDNNKSFLYLHNNLIAILDANNNLSISNGNWFSNTTKERLNALPNVRIQQKNYVWYLNGIEWNGEFITIK